MNRSTIIVLAVGLGALAGCEGDLMVDRATGAQHGDEHVSVGVPGSQGEPGSTQECTGELPPVADVPARLLTSQEINHALGVVFPELDLPTFTMAYDSRVGTFVINSRENVSTAHLRDFRSLAEEVATTVANEVDTVAPCDEGDIACAHDAIDTIGHRAFRRPLESAERDGLRGLYDTGSAEGGHAAGMRYVVEAVLQAPGFVYVVEDVAQPQLNDHAVAQRMAGLLWRGVPDESLLSAAAAGELTTPQGRRDQAERMLADPRAEMMLRSLFMQWLGLDRLPEQGFAQAPELDGLADAMGDETARFIDHVATSTDANWRELLTARYTFVDQRMADHYGIDTESAEEVSEGVWRVEVPGRAGITSHAGFLAVHHGPVHRGLTLRKAVLCGSVASPTGIDLNSIETFEGESERSKAQKRLDHSTCGGCHLQMDPLGLPFETFDTLGAARTEDEHGNMLSGDGFIVGGPEIVDVTSAVELADQLAESDAAEACVARHLFVWTYTRDVRPADACAVDSIGRHLKANDGNIKSTLLDIVAEPAFIERAQGGTQ